MYKELIQSERSIAAVVIGLAERFDGRIKDVVEKLEGCKFLLEDSSFDSQANRYPRELTVSDFTFVKPYCNCEICSKSKELFKTTSSTHLFGMIVCSLYCTQYVVLSQEDFDRVMRPSYQPATKWRDIE